MREPELTSTPDIESSWLPYSQASTQALRVAAHGHNIRYIVPGSDNDFEQRYAAILLKERGQ